MLRTLTNTQQVLPPTLVRKTSSRSNSTESLVEPLPTRLGKDNTYWLTPIEHQKFTCSKARFERSNNINEIKNKLQKHLGSIGLFGITYGSVAGMSLATFATTGLLFVGAAANVIPGFGALVFISIFTLCIVIGAIAQYIAHLRRNRTPEVQALYAQLQVYRDDIAALDPKQMTAQDHTDLSNVIALQSHERWNWKNFGRQIGYGLLGIEPYTQTERWIANLLKSKAKN